MKQIKNGIVDREIQGTPKVVVEEKFFKMKNTLPKSFKLPDVKLNYTEMIEALEFIQGELVKSGFSWYFADEDDVFEWKMRN